MEVHGTVYYETQRPPEVPAFVKNHGLLPQQDLQQLLRKAKVTLYMYHIVCFIPFLHAFLSLRGLSSTQLKSCLFIIPVQLFIGFGFPYEGPAPLEAIANGCIFLQPKFHPPHSSLNHEFFRGKPTSREVSASYGASELSKSDEVHQLFMKNYENEILLISNWLFIYLFSLNFSFTAE